MILNVLFTGEEIRTVIERSDMPMEMKCQMWASFIDYAMIDKRLNNIQVTSKDTELSSGDDGHPNLFV